MHNGISFYLPISLYVTIENSDTILAPKRKTALLFLRRYFSAHDTAGSTYHVRGRKRAHGIRRGDKGVQKTLPGPKSAQKMVAEQQRRQHTAHRNTVINLRHKAGEEIVSQIRRGQHGQNQCAQQDGLQIFFISSLSPFFFPAHGANASNSRPGKARTSTMPTARATAILNVSTPLATAMALSPMMK